MHQQLWAHVAGHGGHVDKSSNTWRATKGARWGVGLGLFGAELGLGPQMKFEAHMMLYDFY
jgi:hypothetical protein